MCTPGMTLDKWGPAAWNVLHVACHSFPEEPTHEEREALRQFLWLFARLLPCCRCRAHFLDLLESTLTSEALRNRSSMVRFMNDAHNEVNARLGKPVWTQEESDRLYDPVYARRVERRRRRTMTALGVVAVAIGGAIGARAWTRRRDP